MSRTRATRGEPPSTPRTGDLGPSGASTARRVAKNTAVPIVATLVNRGLDFVFAIIMLRMLGIEEVGRYTWAVLVLGYFDILVNFGLGVLITRDVARQPGAADRYIGGALVARLALWTASLGAALIIAGPLLGPLGIPPHVGLTLLLLTVGIGISNVSGLASALFNASERMEFPALVAIFTSAMKVLCGVGVLALGFGIVGVAAVAIFVNCLTSMVLLALLVRFLGRPHPSLSAATGFELMRSSYPLMINNLLASLFFRVDGLILHASAGDTVLAWYGTAYKFLDGLNTIPSNLTLALFPVLSRLSEREGSAESGPSSFTRAVGLALRALVSVALPVAVGTTLLAQPIILAFAGPKYLPHSAIALQILIWFAPFSFVNGLLQYVLIAVGRERFITVSFAIATAFNVAANLFAVAHWSYVGAAVVTVASEALLLTLFWGALRRSIGHVGLANQAWRSALAAAAMAPAVWVTSLWSPIPAVAVGAVVYIVVLVLARGVGSDELLLLRRALAAPRAQ